MLWAHLSLDHVSVVPLVIHHRHKHDVHLTTMQTFVQLQQPAEPAHVLAPEPDTSDTSPSNCADFTVKYGYKTV